MKKYIFVILVLFTMLILFKNNDKELEKNNTRKSTTEKRGIFISYIDLEKYVKDSSEEYYKKNIDNMIKNIKDFNFNMIILQVRAFSDAIYESKYFPWSSSVTSDNKPLSFDVLKYFIDKSHENGIELHAWINPYRISNVSDRSKIEKNTYAYKYLESGDASVIDEGIYYNPASKKSQKLILDGIEEILKKYDVDGIHFDDYFYPNLEIDSSFYNDYLKNHKDISVSEFHLMNVNNLIKKTHKLTKKHNVLFGVSPEGNIENNYNKNGADVRLWGSSDEYVDYLMPQIYYGFQNEVQPFYDVLNEWSEIVEESNVKILPALAFYKVGQKDVYAKEGVDEWVNGGDIIMRQVLLSRNVGNYDGFAIFRYDNIFSLDKKEEVTLSEIKNLKKIL